MTRADLCTRDWRYVRPHVEVKCVQRDGETYILARSIQRRAKERAIRKRQLLGLHRDLRKLASRVSGGRLKSADKVLETIGRFRERWPAASRFVSVDVDRDEGGQALSVSWSYDQNKLRVALARDGAYLLLSDKTDWSAEDLWRTYIQLTRAEDAFRAMKSNLLLRPMWHQNQHAGQPDRVASRPTSLCACWLTRCGRPWHTCLATAESRRGFARRIRMIPAAVRRVVP